MLSHTTVGTNDLARAIAFYDAVIIPLGWTVPYDDQINQHYGYTTGADATPQFWLTRPFDQQPATSGNGTNIGFLAKTRAEVDAFHAAALRAGGTCEGAPGLRVIYHPNFYAAYVRDLDGNKIMCVCHRPVVSA